MVQNKITPHKAHKLHERYNERLRPKMQEVELAFEDYIKQRLLWINIKAAAFIREYLLTNSVKKSISKGTGHMQHHAQHKQTIGGQMGNHGPVKIRTMGRGRRMKNGGGARPLT